MQFNARISPEDFREDLCRFLQRFKGNDIGFLRVVPGGERELPAVGTDIYHRLQFFADSTQQGIVLHRRRDAVPEQSLAVIRRPEYVEEFVEFFHIISDNQLHPKRNLSKSTLEVLSQECSDLPFLLLQ